MINSITISVIVIISIISLFAYVCAPSVFLSVTVIFFFNVHYYLIT